MEVVVGSGGAAIPIELGSARSWVLDPDFDKYRHIDPHVTVQTLTRSQEWSRAAENLAGYDPVAVIAGRKKPDRADGPAICSEMATPVTIINGITIASSAARRVPQRTAAQQPCLAIPGTSSGKRRPRRARHLDIAGSDS